jgi:protein-disulfide isomerase
MNKIQGSLSVPVAIIVAGLIIAGAIVFSLGGERVPGTENNTRPTAQENENLSAKIILPAVTADDHIRGSLDAPIKIVEYSDTECPFCKRFHETMNQVMANYNQVAWVYRHFPLRSIHPKAPKEAEATECAAELGGNEVFWQYLDRLFEISPTNNGLDLAELPKIAEFVGLDKKAFEQCLASGKYADKVTQQENEAVAAGGDGTPYSVLITSDGSQFPINGAQPYEVVKQILDTVIKNGLK